MKKIGLTGGIGSGKTTISKVFKILGIPVYNSDEVAKNILNENELIKKKIIKNFGKQVLTEEKIDHKKISKIIFNQKEKLNFINSIIHPLVKNDFNTWCKKQKSKYIIKESAIIYKSKSDKELDYVIFVKTPLETRIKRIQKRDQKNIEEIFSIMKNQSPDDFLKNKCDYTIKNDDNSFLIEQILKLNEIFIK
tara:strand:+ start:1403 stop:1981 length:579 start_codon:yes stop_codon:yes gene_type:complete